MKVVVISKPRSRSSFFSHSVSNFYDLKYHHEPFSYYEKWVKELRVRLSLLNKRYELSELIAHQKKHLFDTMTQLNNEGNYVFKLFPRDIIFSLNGTGIKDDTEFVYEIFTNFNEIIKLESFDKIYFLDRNIVESSISYGYAWVIDHWLFLDQKELNYKTKKIKKINMPVAAFKFMYFHILESVLHYKIKDFLDRKKLNYIALDYNNCENYVEQNLKCSKPNKYVESNFDYKNLILNYNECEDFIQKKVEEYTNQIKNIEFV